jgi:hypothetical protein
MVCVGFYSRLGKERPNNKWIIIFYFIGIAVLLKHTFAFINAIGESGVKLDIFLFFPIMQKVINMKLI